MTPRIGISGWTYPPWRGVFFPPSWPQKRELEFASREVNSIEINGSFYSLQRSTSYKAWYDATPKDFIFSVKGGRFITHLKRLKDVETPLANFYASGVLALREKLGPFLWQLPPSFRFDAARLKDFFDLLPRNTDEASKLAHRHDDKLPNRAVLHADASRPLRHALEVRHASFATRECIDLLRQHDIGLVIADTAGKWPFLEDVTSDFVYIRLHGSQELYVSGYTEAAIREWARKIRFWSRGSTPQDTCRIAAAPAKSKQRQVYVYFDNDVKVRAPFDAMTLAHYLGIGPLPGKAPPVEAIAETARAGWPSIKRRWSNERA